MVSVRPSSASRGSVSPVRLVVGTAVAVSMLALAGATTHVSQAAEPDTGAGLPWDTTAADPALEWAKMAAGSLPQRSAGAVPPMAIPPRAPAPADRIVVVARPALAPSQEWMGMSKLVIPLLVADLVDGQAVEAARAATVRAVTDRR